MTTDYWVSKRARDVFREQFAQEFAELDQQCESLTEVVGVSPAIVVENRGVYAGRVGVESKLGLYSDLEFRLGCRRAAAESVALGQQHMRTPILFSQILGRRKNLQFQQRIIKPIEADRLSMPGGIS